MKHKLLSLLVISAGMSLVACGGDDKPTMANGQLMCGTQACSMHKAALGQVQGSPEQEALRKAGITPPGAPPVNTNPLAQVGADDSNTRKPDGLASVSDKQIKQQAAKVMAALEADKHNPDSPYYVPPVEETPSLGRSPSSIQPAAVAEVQMVPTMVQGSGETAQ